MTELRKIQIQRLVSLALFEELDRTPTKEEVEKYSRVARVVFEAVVKAFLETKLRANQQQLSLF